MFASFFLAVCQFLPWLIVAAVAGYMLYKRKGDKALSLQVLGSAGMFLLGMGQWLVVEVIVDKVFGKGGFEDAARIVFEFLVFVSLMIFVAGYCLERFYKNKAAVVTASPA